MKNVTLLVILALAGYAGYVVWINYHKPPPPPEVVVIEATPPPTTPPPTPIPRRLAPEGTFFLIEYVSVQTSDGIVGYKPGTTVVRVKESGDTMRVKTATTELDVKHSQITNDLDIAARAGALDARAQQLMAISRARMGNIAIISATYGWGNAVADVSLQVRAELAKGNNTIRADHDLVGSDPAPGKRKILTIHYSIGSDPSTTATAEEGDFITLGSSQPPPQNPPPPEIRYIQAPERAPNPLDRGAYNEKRGAARAPVIYDPNRR